MYKLFEKESIVAYIFYSIILMLIGFKVFALGQLDTYNQGSFFLNNVLKSSTISPLLIRGLVFFLLVVCFFIFSFIYRNFSFHSKEGLVFQFVLGINTLVALALPYSLESVLTVFFFLILSLFFINTDQKRDTVTTFFNIGFTFSISIFVSFSMIFFTLPVAFSFFIYSKNGVRDILAFGIGIFSPILILFSILIILNLEDKLFLLFNPYIHISYKLLKNWEWVIFSILVFSAFITIPKVGLFTINTRKFYIYLFFAFLSTVSFYLFAQISHVKNHFLVMLLASFYFTPFLIKLKNYRLKNLILIFGIIIAFFTTFVQLK